MLKKGFCVAQFEVDTIFGEMSFVGVSHVSATIRAASRCTVQRIACSYANSVFASGRPSLWHPSQACLLTVGRCWHLCQGPLVSCQRGSAPPVRHTGKIHPCPSLLVSCRPFLPFAGL